MRILLETEYLRQELTTLWNYSAFPSELPESISARL